MTNNFEVVSEPIALKQEFFLLASRGKPCFQSDKNRQILFTAVHHEGRTPSDKLKMFAKL